MTEYLLRILLAGIIGIIIGVANTSVNKALSSRMYAIICMGSALVTITSIGFFHSLDLPWLGEPNRLPAHVISALGFLGAGFLWVAEDRRVVGISNAASLWVTAILGMVVGSGLYNISTLGVLFFLFLYWISHMAEGFGWGRK